MKFNLRQAKCQLSRLLDLAQQGEEVIITRHGTPVAELIPARKKGSILLGSARGTLLTDSDDWWQPERDEELIDWYGN